MAVQEICEKSGASSPSWAPAIIALFGVLLTLLGKWWMDRRAEHRRAAADLAGALSELEMNRDECVRLGLQSAFGTYREAAKAGKPFPLLAPLREEMFPITRKSLESVGVLSASTAADLTAVYFRASAVISTMKSIQAAFLASPDILDKARRDSILETLYGLAERQVGESVKLFDEKQACLLRAIELGRRW